MEVEPTNQVKMLQNAFGQQVAAEQFAAAKDPTLAASRPSLGAGDLWTDQWFDTVHVVSQQATRAVAGNPALGMVVEDRPATAAAVSDGERDMLLIRCVFVAVVAIARDACPPPPLPLPFRIAISHSCCAARVCYGNNCPVCNENCMRQHMWNGASSVEGVYDESSCTLPLFIPLLITNSCSLRSLLASAHTPTPELFFVDLTFNDDRRTGHVP